MILPVLVFASNFVFTLVIPNACVCPFPCACEASVNQALGFGKPVGILFKH